MFFYTKKQRRLQKQVTALLFCFQGIIAQSQIGGESRIMRTPFGQSLDSLAVNAKTQCKAPMLFYSCLIEKLTLLFF